MHDLLIMDKHPGTQGSHPAISRCRWCKNYGKGRVFYTSLGHREDIWDADPTLKDRKNDPAISKAYQQHVLGGIEWALGLKPVPRPNKSGSAVFPFNRSRPAHNHGGAGGCGFQNS